MTAPAVRVLLALSPRLHLSALASALSQIQDISLVGEADNGREAVKMAETTALDVAVLGLFLPHLNGLDTARLIGELRRPPKTVLVGPSSPASHVVAAIRVGARGYVDEKQPWSDLVRAIHKVDGGGVFFGSDPEIAITDALRNPTSAERIELTPREREVLQLIAEGKSTKEIADLLNISVHTVNAIRGHLMTKLDIHNVAGLTRYAVGAGLVKT